MKTTQCQRILRHLKDYGEISSLDAMREYGILRLASRIHDLRKMGIAITSTTVAKKNRYDEITHFKVYRLDER